MPSIKEIYNKIDDVRIEADSVNLNVDGLEALASTQQADVAAIRADLADGVTAFTGGETPSTGTATLTNDTRWELNTEGFGTIAFEIVSTGVTWSSNGVVAQAYNGAAPTNSNLFAPAGIRYRHADDTAATPSLALNNVYWNLNIGPTVGNAFGTNLIRVDGSNSGSWVLPATGPRYFLFDLTTARFALRPFFTAGSVAVNYRLYKGRHPYFSARNVIVKGEAANGSVAINGTVVLAGGSSVDASGSTVSVDGGYLDAGFIENEVFGALNTYAAGYNDPLPITGTVTANSNFAGTNGTTLPSNIAILGAEEDGTGNAKTLQADGSGFLKVSIQESGVTIDGKIFAWGGSGDVDITATTDGSKNRLDVSASGTVTANAGTGSFTVAQATAANLKGQVQILNSAGSAVVAPAEVGTAGNPSIDVLSIQGVTSGTPLTILNHQGTTVTTSNFTSTTASTVLASANSSRKVLTIFNEGAGNLHICAGATCTTIAYQVRLSAGDYYEVPLNQTSLTHSAVFASAGTARIVQIS